MPPTPHKTPTAPWPPIDENFSSDAKARHYWNFDINKRHRYRQCPYVMPIGSADNYYRCCWRGGHPAELGHQASGDGDYSDREWRIQTEGQSSDELQRLRADHKKAMRDNRVLSLLIMVLGLGLLLSAFERIWTHQHSPPPAAPILRPRAAASSEPVCLVRWPSGLDLIADAAPACGIPRQVPCPANCAVGETADTTQRCIFDRELYKQDGKGCISYVPVCWCKLPCPPMPEVLKL